MASAPKAAHRPLQPSLSLYGRRHPHTKSCLGFLTRHHVPASGSHHRGVFVATALMAALIVHWEGMVRVLVTHYPVSISHLRPLSFHLLEHRVLTLNLSPQHPSRVRAAQRPRVTPSRSWAPTFEQLYLPQNYFFYRQEAEWSGAKAAGG